jgi:chemotaxis protein MotA
MAAGVATEPTSTDGLSAVFIIIGLVLVFGSIIGGYTMEHGKLAVLIQPAELFIIGGAGIGSFVVGNPPAVMKAALQQTLALLKPNPYTEAAYGELLQALYDVFQIGRAHV